MFISYSDLDKCLKEGSFHDEIIVLPLNNRAPEFLMTQINDRNNNWRLCQAKRMPGTDNAQFTKRTYLEKFELDSEKYYEYFEKEIRPLIERSNHIIRKKFPEVVFLT